MTGSQSAAPAEQLRGPAIGIVGAGVGGLTFALICKHLGLGNLQVFERTTTSQAPDFTLEISANASRVLHAVGLESSLTGQAIKPQFSYLRTHRTGFVVNQRPLGAFSESRYGAPDYLITQRGLLQVLEDACESAGIRIHRGVSVNSVTPKSGRLVSQEKDIAQFAAVVLASGSDSKITGQSLLPSARDTASGPLVIHGVSGHALDDHCIHTWTGPDCYCRVYPIPGGRSDIIAVLTGTPAPAEPRVRLEDTLRRWHPQLTRIVDSLETANQIQAVDQPPLPHWFEGRCVLLGDTCHPLPAYAAQGACCAIEDAWVLAIMMERWEATPAGGFESFQRFRLPRCRRMYRAAVEECLWLTQAQTMSIWKRNFASSMTSRFLPEIAMQQLDWLYGYDCIKGFN